MIVLDTNVLSEALRPSPSPVVMRWIASQYPEQVFTTTITQAEILFGLEIVPAGKRRNRLSGAIHDLFASEFHGRILPFDEEAAVVFPKIVAHRQAIGRPISQFDALIASICRSRGASVATRNTMDFDHCGIMPVNPWDE
jgi:predicted nucleic acid-binding protein